MSVCRNQYCKHLKREHTKLGCWGREIIADMNLKCLCRGFEAVKEYILGVDFGHEGADRTVEKKQ